MKRILFTLIFFILSLSLFIDQSHAVQLAVGTKVWVVDWDPWFDKAIMGPHNTHQNLSQDFYSGMFVMGGLNFSLVQGNFGLSAGAYYGGNALGKYTSSYNMNSGNKIYHIDEKGSFSASRWDFDAALSYRIISQFKVFAGYKGQRYEMMGTRLSGLTEVTSNVYETGGGNQYTSVGFISGPGIGAGYTYDMGPFLIGATLSVAFLTGDYTLPEFWDPNPNSSLPSDYGMNLKATAINGEPFIGFKAGDRALFLVGFRYQTFNTEVESKKPDNPNYSLGSEPDGTPIYKLKKPDTFWGLSFTYSILF
ncbi:MAG: hypothetical protein JW827_12340 [Spirochaetes bacterium]|nr:hypothetical protein [Spirochaetota bacterium]